jgi:hypothetical protein
MYDSQAPANLCNAIFITSNEQVSGSSPLVSSLFTRVLIADHAGATEEYIPKGHTRGLKRSSTFRNYTRSEPRFRAVLTESGAKVIE